MAPYPVLPDGTVPQGIEARAEACWRNIIAILADAGMGVRDLVKITTYLVRPEDVAAAGAARAKHFGDARPGSATIIVKALVRPEWLTSRRDDALLTLLQLKVICDPGRFTRL